MLVPELKSSQRHPPSPKELGETEVKSRDYYILDPLSQYVYHLRKEETTQEEISQEARCSSKCRRLALICYSQE